MVEEQIEVKRWDFRPSWWFVRQNDGTYICKQVKYTYRLFLEPLGTSKPCWIGMLCKREDGQEIWVTCEKEIHAMWVEFSFGRFMFW